ncbi:MAG TPA: hypothetical protein VFO11_05265, partial [Candidatus Polarisedimenticolaceae bacterium]|nr:hypothetical protein [Candidatus Polarisedimenticolaceae bacterium]
LRDTFFPHIHGRAFVQEAWRRGGAKAIDALYEAPEKWPASTEQILHPEKYFQRDRIDPPREVPEVAEIQGTPTFQQDVLGEWMIYAWLASYVGPAEARRASEGWGGDRLAIAVKPGGLSSRLQTEWDTARDAQEFAQALTKLFKVRLGKEASFREGDPGTLIYERDDRRVSLRRMDRSVELSEEMPCAFCTGSEMRKRARPNTDGGQRPAR